MSQKGFTLVELLVTIVILGIITGMSWPVIRGLQENNKISQYKQYGEAMVSAAKLYIDSYEEDLFYYEDDLTTAQKNTGQNGCVSLTDLIEMGFMRDINMPKVSCYSNFSFVKVTRKKGNYTYTYYLGCGKKKYTGGTGKPALLGDGELTFSFSEGKNITNLTSSQKSNMCKNNFTIS